MPEIINLFSSTPVSSTSLLSQSTDQRPRTANDVKTAVLHLDRRVKHSAIDLSSAKIRDMNIFPRNLIDTRVFASDPLNSIFELRNFTPTIDMRTGDRIFKRIRESNMKLMKSKYNSAISKILANSIDAQCSTRNVAPRLIPALLIRGYINEYIRDASLEWSNVEHSPINAISILARLRNRISTTVARIQKNDNDLMIYRAHANSEERRFITNDREHLSDVPATVPISTANDEHLTNITALIDMFNIYFSTADIKSLAQEEKHQIHKKLISFDALLKYPDTILESIDRGLHSLISASNLKAIQITNIEDIFNQLSTLSNSMEENLLPSVDIRYAPDIFFASIISFSKMIVDDLESDNRIDPDPQANQLKNDLKLLIDTEEPNTQYPASKIYNDFKILRNRYRHQYLKQELIRLKMKILDLGTDEPDIAQRIYDTQSSSLIFRQIGGPVLPSAALLMRLGLYSQL